MSLKSTLPVGFHDKSHLEDKPDIRVVHSQSLDHGFEDDQLLADPTKQELICVKHSGPYMGVCFSCSTALCSQCLPDHRTHETRELRRSLFSVQQKLSEYSIRLDSQNELLSLLTDSLSQLNAAQFRSSECYKRSVESAFNHLAEAITERKLELLATVDRLTETHSFENSNIQQDIKTIQKRIQQVSTSLQETLPHTNSLSPTSLMNFYFHIRTEAEILINQGFERSFKDRMYEMSFSLNWHHLEPDELAQQIELKHHKLRWNGLQSTATARPSLKPKFKAKRNSTFKAHNSVIDLNNPIETPVDRKNNHYLLCGQHVSPNRYQTTTTNSHCDSGIFRSPDATVLQTPKGRKSINWDTAKKINESMLQINSQASRAKKPKGRLSSMPSSPNKQKDNVLLNPVVLSAKQANKKSGKKK